MLLALSEAIYDLVFANLAYSITGATSSVTTTYAVGYVAEILMTLIGAGFIDRFDKWKLFLGTQLLNIGVFLCAMVMLSIHDQSVGLVWLFAFLVDLIHQYSRLILFALVPFLFGRGDIIVVNGFLGIANATARAAGPALGAIVIFQIGLPSSLVTSVGLMLAALLLGIYLWREVRLVFEARDTVQENTDSFAQRFHESVTGAFKATLILGRSKEWRGFLGAYSACVLVIGVLSLLWIPLLRDFHAFSVERTGYLFAVGTAGAVLGGLALKRLGSEGLLPTLIIASHGLMVVGVCVSLFFKGELIAVGVGMFLFQCGAAVYFRSTASAIQLSVPREVIGSWYGAIDFISRFVGLLGILAAGYAYDVVGVYWVYSVLLVLLVMSAWNWIPKRAVRLQTET